MKKVKAKSEPFRFYTEGEMYVEHLPRTGGEPERVIRMRFKTHDVHGARESHGTTPWVIFTLPGAERLSTQLAAVVETAKRWTPGSDAELVGSNLGIAVRREDA